jgi:hypothetical protein|nr:hypothetical protein [uncultured Mediterranean phage uvMED]|tara:strand:- start:176 stop:349 length:174 start_codon:yes stop_codon:yes gene_type:complete
MSHEEIKLATPTRMFTFEQLSRDIDKINDVEVLRDMTKSHIKLYLKQQEVVASLGLM